MATEVLRPHDVLIRSRHSFRSHRKPNPNLNPKSSRKTPPPASAKNGGGKAGESKRGGAKREGVYAGSGFAISPEPSSLPLPSFQVRRVGIPAAAAAAAAMAVVVDEAATIDLRRMLRLG